MSHSTLEQPLGWPTKDTIYKIIIADSSGCGDHDTAFKKILVRTYPTAHLQFTDTAICGNAVLKIPVAFAGGDSNYTWQWYFVFSKTSFFPSVKGSSKLSDTLIFSPTEPKETMAIVLKDGCTAKADTAYITISQRNPVVIKNQFKDTSLCSGNYLKYKAIASGGIPKQYRYQWKDLVEELNYDPWRTRAHQTCRTWPGSPPVQGHSHRHRRHGRPCPSRRGDVQRRGQTRADPVSSDTGNGRAGGHTS